MKKIINTFFAAVIVMYPLSAQGNIFWELYLQSTINSEPILRKETAVGQEFAIRESDFTGVPSRSRTIVEALDGVSLLFNHCPLTGDVVFRMILNVQGNAFSQVRQVPLFCNITFEGYSDGSKAPVVQFPKSEPLVMRIPHDSGLDYLLGTCNLAFEDDLLFVYNTGASFDNSSISTVKTSSALVVNIEQLSDVVGGVGESLGYPASTRVDTWSKIKLLFR